jgi:hypothetical protein
MTKRDQWRGKAARYLRWHRAARKAPLNNWESSGAWLRMYREARQYADYWQRHGEQARAPSWYYPD